MKLRDIVPPALVVSVDGDMNVEPSGLAYDSRDVLPGYVFFALPGLHADGHRFIHEAIRAGASAIIHEQALEAPCPAACCVRVNDARAAMSPVASAFYGSPSRRLAVIGVTGTEGKSTTVWLIYRLLDLAGKKAGFFSTVDRRIGGAVEPNPRHQTTPEATSVQRMLDSMANAGYEYAVVEASSHGLSPRTGRLTDVAFDVGVMTNVRHEHLEFHGTWERYRDDKARLFSALDTVSHRKRIGGVDRDVAAFGVVCADDPSAGHFSHATKHRVYSYSSTSAAADLYASDIQSDDSGSSFVIHDRTGEHPDEDHAYPARIELPGYFNVENTLAAVLVVSRLTGIGVRELVPLLPRMEPVLGRMTRLVEGQPFEVLVDYAHTPSSFEAILPPLRARITGKLICVFGSGGERDVQKRPAQGRIASTYCDVVILADEDPRGEDPVALLKDIAAGCESMEYDVDLFLIPDRRVAIRKAVSIAKPGDAVLLLGKGHEHTIDYASGSIPWNELEEARLALADAGYKASSR